MAEHYIIVADRGHLRIFAENSEPGLPRSGLEAVIALDFPDGMHRYTAHDSDQAGRFPGSKGQAVGMSIDERLPMQEQRDHRLVRDLADRINGFLRMRPQASWSFAAGPAVHHAVLNRIEPAVKSRLRRAVVKDLVNQPQLELREQFSI